MESEIRHIELFLLAVKCQLTALNGVSCDKNKDI